MKSYKGIIYAILSSSAFGLMPIFAKITYKNGSNPTTVLIFRFMISALILFTYLNYKKINITINKNQLILLLLIGVIGYTLTTHTLFIAYDYLGAGLATTLHFIYPIVACIMGFILFKENITKNKIISMLLTVLGVYSLISFKNNKLNIIGISLALFSGVSYGLNIIALNLKSIKSLDNRIVTMYVCFGATLGMTVFGIFDKSIILNINVPVILSYLGISLISTIASIILLLKAIKLIGVSSSSILGTFEPIVSIILGIIFLGENLSFSLIIGTLLILLSTIILAKDK